MKLRSSFILLFFVAVLTACNSADTGQIKILQTEVDNLKNQLAISEAAQADGQFIHTVFFWMKEDLDDASRTQFESGLKSLTGIDVVKRSYLGKAAGTPREVVDNSYDYALILHFANAADQNAYQVHPTHTAFVEASQGTWDRVQVYDTLAE